MDSVSSKLIFPPLLMILVTLLGKKNTWASQILFFKLLAAKAALVAQKTGHSSSYGFLLWTGPNSGFFGHQKFFSVFGFILARHLVKKSRLKKRYDLMAFCGGHCVLCVKINPPTCKSAFLWARKKEKNRKNNIVKYIKNRQSFEHFFRDGAFFL